MGQARSAQARTSAARNAAAVGLLGWTCLCVSPATLAAELFALLRSAEELGLAHLVIEAVPGSDVGRAVMDRLRRASVASGGTTHGTVAP